MWRLLAIALACLGWALICVPARGQEVLEGVAGVVNHDVITFSRVRDLTEEDAKRAREYLRGQELVKKIQELRAVAVQKLIDRTLMVQEFNLGGRAIPPAAIDERIQQLIDGRFAGDRPAFLRWLTARGYTLPEFREEVREDIIVGQMRQEAVAGSASESEAKEKEQDWLQELRKKAYIKLY